MKLIIQIPCYNEEETLPLTLKHLPRELEGVDKIEWLIIDDGSTDRTAEVARENGVDHIVTHINNSGLALAFMTGIEECLRLDADIILNTDADNQYDASCIPDLISPILEHKADIVIGERPVSKTDHFSLVKKILQKFGSYMVRVISNTKVADAPSGFRAISRNAAMKINIFSEYTYTLETIIQAGQKNISIVSVPIKTNEFTRPSRLFKSIPSYIKKSIITIIRIYMTYRPLKFFFYIGLTPFIGGVFLLLRFLYYYFTLENSGHIQSLIIASLLMGSGVGIWLMGLITDLIAVNRKLLEKTSWRIHNIERILNEKSNS